MKKLMDKIPEVHQQILDKAKSPALGKYIWEVLFSEQLGYAFNAEHTYSYSLIGVQCAYLATYFPILYWNTACLRVDAGLENDASTCYNKIAKAVGTIIQNGIKVSLIDINKSKYFFEPNEETESIIYGLKGVANLNGDRIEEIIMKRPYHSLEDFMSKVQCNKTEMVSLIKGGAFDAFGPREEIMDDYLWSICSPKKRLTMQNFNGLAEKGLLPEELEFSKRVFVFDKALKKFCKKDDMFVLKADNYYNFYIKFFDDALLIPTDEGKLGIKQDKWKTLYQKAMNPAKEYIKEHQEELLEAMNQSLFQDEWNKYASGNLSSWEMDSLGMYYHEHELKNTNYKKYGVVSFKSLGVSPKIEKYITLRNGREIPLFKTNKIIGTVIAKDDMKSSISLLTPESGVVNVKFNRDYYAKYNRRLSEVQPDGTKKVIEPGWFQKGTLVAVNGIRRGDTFMAKSYKSDGTHKLYKIIEIAENGDLVMTNERATEEGEN